MIVKQNFDIAKKVISYDLMIAIDHCVFARRCGHASEALGNMDINDEKCDVRLIFLLFHALCVEVSPFSFWLRHMCIMRGYRPIIVTRGLL